MGRCWLATGVGRPTGLPGVPCTHPAPSPGVQVTVGEDNVAGSFEVWEGEMWWVWGRPGSLGPCSPLPASPFPQKLVRSQPGRGHTPQVRRQYCCRSGSVKARAGKRSVSLLLEKVRLISVQACGQRGQSQAQPSTLSLAPMQLPSTW